MTKTFLLSITIIITFCSKICVADAAGASLNLSPNSGTFFVGSTFDVSIFLNTGENNVNAVQVGLKFDPKKLQIANPTTGRSFISVWVVQPAYSNVQGTALFQGGVPSPGINTSAGLVSTITFRVISPGDTIISFSTSSQILLDDGMGTDVLSSMGKGVYHLAIAPPEGPTVFSLTHPDQNKWYKNNNPTFSWIQEEGFSDFSYDFNNDSQGIPDSDSEGASASVSYQDIESGVWYFHVKAKKDGIWGGTSHYLTQIDNVPPAEFVPKIEPSAKTTFSQPVVSFVTTDALSGFDHFELKVINVTPDQNGEENWFFTEVISPYKLPSLKVGKYIVTIRAFDKAGNWRDASIKLEIIPSGLHIDRDGIYLWGLFLKWCQVALLILIILILITIFLYIKFKKQEKLRKEMKERLKIKESVLKDEAINMNTKTDQIIK